MLCQEGVLQYIYILYKAQSAEYYV